MKHKINGFQLPEDCGKWKNREKIQINFKDICQRGIASKYRITVAQSKISRA